MRRRVFSLSTPVGLETATKLDSLILTAVMCDHAMSTVAFGGSFWGF